MRKSAIGIMFVVLTLTACNKTHSITNPELDYKTEIFGTWTLDADGTTISLVSDDYCDFSQDGDMTQDEDMTESSCLNAGGQWEPSETISGTVSGSELTINVTDSEESECMGATASAADECTDAGGEWEEADNSCYEFILIGE